MLVEVYYEIKKSSGLPEIIPLKANLRSAKEVAVDHFMKMKMKHRTTVKVPSDDGGTKRWTIGPLTDFQIQSKPPQIRKGKKFANLEYEFWPGNREKPRWAEERLVEARSEEDFRSEILNTMNDLEKKVDSDVQKAPKGTPLDLPQSTDNAKKKVLSIAFRNLIGEINKDWKEESLPLEELRPEILAIKEALELMKLAREEFGEEMNEVGKDLRVLWIKFSRVIGDINGLEKTESLSKLHSEILAIKEALELMRLLEEEFGMMYYDIGKEIGEVLDLKRKKK